MSGEEARLVLLAVEFLGGDSQQCRRAQRAEAKIEMSCDICRNICLGILIINVMSCRDICLKLIKTMT